MSIERPELVFALTGAVGTPLKSVADRIVNKLDGYGYRATEVSVSAALRSIKGLNLSNATEVDRLKSYMSAGSEVRERTKQGDALAALAVAQVRSEREKLTGSAQTPHTNWAYVLRSLKHPDEIETLRGVYRDHLVVIGVHADRDTRVRQLASQLGGSSGMKGDNFRGEAEQLIVIDEREPNRKLGQRVGDAFPLSDFFVDSSDVAGLDGQIDRMLRLAFSSPFVTPTRHEVGMFYAHAAGLRSAALGRQVGAAIVDAKWADVLAVGMNEVPRFRGGHYWEGDSDDARDFRREFDANDSQKQGLVRQVLDSLRKRDWLAKTGTIDELVEEATGPEGVLHESGILSLTEFGRDVHAEMSAIVSAARRGISIDQALLFTTTFPCHNCTKHIVAAGITTVVYIEPYPKSFAVDLHHDSIAIDGRDGTHVAFIPFVGVAPRRYVSWFSMKERKRSGGKIVNWMATTAVPRFTFTDPGYITRERDLVDRIATDLHNAKLEAT